MAVITDPGKSFEAIPHHDEFRDVFLTRPTSAAATAP